MSSPACSTSPWAARVKEASHPAHRHILHPNSCPWMQVMGKIPAQPPLPVQGKQLQAQHPPFHLEIRRNGLRAASFPSTSSRSKCQKPFLTPCCKTQTRPIKLLHRQVRNKLPLASALPCAPALHRESEYSQGAFQGKVTKQVQPAGGLQSQ